jgi:L-seryl-tRNA(Ser) seleniumtransferase
MDLRRHLPSVDSLLSSDAFAPVLAAWPRAVVASAVRAELETLRAHVAAGSADVPDAAPGPLAGRVAAALATLAAGSLVPVINASGVVLHTNLGRAPLAASALDAMRSVAEGYSNLEYSIETGSRGSRYTHCRALLQRLTGAADALVVNNNAAALVLALNTVAQHREAIVSRGELVEIGGAFRVPDIMARSGAQLREVGSTNRTHVDDYRAALGAATGALLKVHPSNFTIRGYTAEASVRDLAPVAAEGGVPLIHDIGSGLLLDPASLGLDADEPTPMRSLADGADIVTMSGDKLLGGPQCGVVLGSAEYIERMRRNPLCRALRVDKLTIAALEATLRLYLDPAAARREIPVLRMITLPRGDIAQRADAFAGACRSSGWDADVRPGDSAVGGGASPDTALPTMHVVLSAAGSSAAELERRLRGGTPCVVARLIDDRLCIDLRTVAPHEEAALLDALRAALA